MVAKIEVTFTFFAGHKHREKLVFEAHPELTQEQIREGIVKHIKKEYPEYRILKPRLEITNN